jgi:hypothetical protein
LGVHRLSVIVPLISDIPNMESTLLSVLEHRDRHCEVIVVHDGSYADPYQLDGDQIVLIQASGNVNGLINEAIHASVAPVIQILLPGTIVEAAWFEDVVTAFENDDELGAVAASVFIQSLSAKVVGLKGSQLTRHQLLADYERNEIALPCINGGYFRRQLLLALDGLIETTSLLVAETELAAAIQSLDTKLVRYDEARIQSKSLAFTAEQSGYHEGQQLAQLARAYSSVETSPIQLDNFALRMGKLAASLLNPSSIAHRLGWTLGLQDTSLVKLIADRIQNADDAWQAYLDKCEADRSRSTYRRAA